MGQSPGEKVGGEVQRREAGHALELYKLGSPGLRLSLDDFLRDLGKPGQEPDSVRRAFSAASDQQTAQFDQQAQALPLTANQQILQQGGRTGQGAGENSANQMLIQLEAQRRASGRQLEQQRIDAGMQQRDYDLSNILGIAQGGIQSSFGFSQNALGAAQHMGQGPWGGAMSGAAAGASVGSAFGPWGGLVGGIAGGAAGYFGTGR